MIDVRKIRVAIRIVVTATIWLAAIRPSFAGVPKLPLVDPEAVGLDAAQLNFIDAAVADEIAAKRLPGCVVLIGRQGRIAYQKAFGQRQSEPESMPMTIDTVFDLASVTKPVATATSVMILIEQVERVSGKNVHEFSQEHIFRPLGMAETGYLPNAEIRARAAPTERRGDRWMQGEVHDPRAHRLGGIAGHAGLFSTAADLAVYAQTMLNRGTYAGVRILNPKTVELMTGAVAVPAGLRALGWDMRTRYSINRGETMSSAAYGHGGFTGTALWIDPQLDLFVIFLSNRVHPNGKGLVNPLIGRIGTIAGKAIVARP